MKGPIWSASVMCANLGRLEEDFQALEAAGCHELHFDVMDGAFVPALSLGAEFIAAAKACTGLACDVHLMTERPDRHVDAFIEAGCDSLTVHVETCRHAHRTLVQIREAGASPGIAVNPATSLTKLEYLLPYADRALVMTVDPGHPGQKIISGAFERVKILKENIDYRKLKTKIQAEGDMDAKNAAILANAGVEVFVLDGASIFDGPGLAHSLAAFETAVEQQRKVV